MFHRPLRSRRQGRKEKNLRYRVLASSNNRLHQAAIPKMVVPSRLYFLALPGKKHAPLPEPKLAIISAGTRFGQNFASFEPCMVKVYLIVL